MTYHVPETGRRDRRPPRLRTINAPGARSTDRRTAYQQLAFLDSWATDSPRPLPSTLQDAIFRHFQAFVTPIEAVTDVLASRYENLGATRNIFDMIVAFDIVPPLPVQTREDITL